MPPHPSTVLAPAIFFATESSPGRFLLPSPALPAGECAPKLSTALSSAGCSSALTDSTTADSPGTE